MARLTLPQRFLVWLFLAAASIVAITFLMPPIYGQNNIGQVKAASINTDYFVGTSPFSTTIQSALKSACASTPYNHLGRVIIPVGVTPSDTIVGATGCNGVSILDYRTFPWACYQWGGAGPYSAVSCAGGGGGGSPSLPFLSAQFNKNGVFGALPLSTDSTFVQLIAQSVNIPINGNNYAGFFSTGCSPTALVNLTSGNVSQSCSNMGVDIKVKGWNLGGIGTGGAGWYSYLMSDYGGFIRSAGLHSVINSLVHFAGRGDVNHSSHLIYCRGGVTYSDEGCGSQEGYLEDKEPVGTVTSYDGSTKTLTTNSGTQEPNGTGQTILDTATDVLTTTLTYVSDSTNYSTYTSSTTLPVSNSCSTVATGVTLPVQEEGVYTSSTITLNTATNLSGTVGKMFASVLPFLQGEKIVSVGTLSGGLQTITILLNKSVLTGSPYCIGGAATRYVNSTQYNRNSKIYPFFVLGSPNATTLLISYQTNQAIQSFGYAAGAATIYHAATIVQVSGTNDNIFTLTDNDATWANGTSWLSPNANVAYWYWKNHSMRIDSPLHSQFGEKWEIFGSPAFGDSYFHQFFNEIPASNYRYHGGTYNAPNLQHIKGVVGTGQYWDNSPESAGIAGNGNDFVPGAISGGAPAAGNSQALWFIFGYRPNNDNFYYNTANRRFGVNTGGSGRFDIDGSPACTYDGTTAVNCPPNTPGAVTYDLIGSGTNLGHGLVCGNGCVQTTAGTGVNNANELNGILLSGLATCIIKNTTSTGVPVCAVSGTDYVVPSGSITGTAAGLSAASALPNNTTATTQAINDNSTKLATTAFYAGQKGTTNPLINGTAAPGSSLLFAPQDHVHPTDTTRQAAGNYITGLTGDVTAAGPGSVAATVVRVNGLAIPASANYVGTNASSQFITKTLPWTCQPGFGDGLNVIVAGTYLQTVCYNDTGQTITITGIKCYADAGSPTLAVTNGAGTALLSSAVTCTTSFAAGTQSGTTTIAAGDVLKFTYVDAASTKQSSWVVTGTRP